MVNHFEVFSLPISLKVDHSALKKKFYVLSRTYHPDHFTLESQDKQDEALAMTGAINLAYKVLADDMSRIKHILELNDIMIDEGKQMLTPDFLMEMMEFNEQIDDAKTKNDQSSLVKLNQNLLEMKSDLDQVYERYSDDFDNQRNTNIALEKIKDYYFKSKYLLRIQENLGTFAHS